MIEMMRTIFKTIAKENKGYVRNWRFVDLEKQQYLYSSDTLKMYAEHAIKFKDKENALIIAKYIKRHEAGDIKSYQSVLKLIKRTFKDIDITDFF